MKKTLTVILALVMVLVLAGIPNTAMAQPGLIKCTVSYNGNGNTSGSPPGDTKYDWMTTATVQGYSNLQKTGYTIIGWKDDSGNIRQPGFTWTILLSTEFDAVWKANTYEITFDAGLHGKIGTSQTYKVNADYNTTPSAPTNVNADTGWRFTGWSPTVTTVTGPTTYTAQYVQQYKITFDAGTKGHFPEGQYRYVYKDINTTPADPRGDIILNTGYVFTGWDPATITPATAAKTYTALTDLRNYTVTFDAWDHGTIDGNRTKGVSVKHGATAAAPTVTPNTGYRFNHWQESINNITGNKTVHAIYDCLTTYYLVHGTIGGQRTLTVPAPDSDGDWDSTFDVYDVDVIDPDDIVPDAGYDFDEWSDWDFNHFDSFHTNEPESVTAEYDYTEYEITFKITAGKGTFAENGSDTITKMVPKRATPTAPAVNAATGWALAGWAPDIHAATSKQTYTAKFNPEYTVRFMDGSSLVTTRKVTLPDTTVGTLPAVPPVTGYTPDGWATSTGTPFYGTTTVNADITVYAQRHPNYIYTVTFMDGATTVGTRTVTSPDTHVSSLPNLPAPPSGQINEYWQYGGAQFTTSTTVSASITVTPKRHTAYVYTVTFKDGATEFTRTVTEPATTVSDVPTVPYVYGFTADGWKAEGASTFFSTTTPVTGSITVLAVRHPDYEYTVTFMDGTTTVDTRTVTSPATTVSSLPNLPAPPAGQINEYWQYGGAQFTTATTVSGSITVTPKRHTAYVYTVTFKDRTSESTRTVTEPATTVTPFPADPTNTGYNFGGWFTQPNGAGDRVTASTTITHSMDVYAYWANYSYKVTYMSKGSEYTNQMVNSPNVNVGALPAEPVNLGYKFGGWYTGVDGTGTEFKADTTLTGPITVFANWLNYSYTVNFDKTDGETEASPNSKTVATPDYNVGTLPAPPTRTGYNFGGWYTGRDGTGTEFKADTLVTDSIRVYAKWNTYSYTVDFDKTDGDTEASPNSKTVATPDINVGTLPTPPERSGYNFGGWYTGRDGAGTEFKADTTVTGSIRVYAKWNTYSYTVDFDKTDGETEASPNSKTVATPDINVGTLPAPPTRTGYNFGGWYTGRDGAGTEFKADTLVTGSIRVYAKWNTYSYTVDFDKTDGETEANPNSKTVATPDINVGTLPAPPTRTGYNFGGWYTGRDGTGTEFKADTTVTGSIRVYAKWNTYSYTVDFDKTDGETEASPNSKTVATPDINVGTLPAPPTRTGYNFGGWYTGRDGTGTEFKADTTVTGSIRVYAKWNTYSYTVDFDKTDGETEASPNSKTVATPDINVGTLPAPPTRTGYNFGGWYTGRDGAGTEFKADTLVTGSIRVYAKWNTYSYTVDFDKTDGETEASPNSKTVNTPDINVGTLPAPPARTGYNFGGWYTGRDGAGTEFKADTTVTGSIRVYAKWNTYSYKVDYVSGGAPYGSKTVDSPAVNVGALPTQPTKTGYNFGGWFTGQNGTGTEFKADTTVTGPITVYAYWAPYSYTVTFNKNGGDTDATPATKTVASPSTNVGMLPAQPSRTGYEFQGWKTSGGTDFDASTTVSGNMTVFAQWKIKTFTVTFNPGLHGELDPNSPNGLVQTVEYNKNALPPVIDTDPGYRFLGWNVSYNNVTGDITITARYAIRTYTLTVNVQGNGTVTGIAGTYNYGTVIDLGDAGVTPANGYQFTEFRNADGDPVTSVTLYGNRTVTAVFTAVAVTPQGSPAASPAASPAGTPAPTQNIPENQVPQAGPGNQGQGSGFSLYWLFLIIGLPLIILAILLFIILGKRRKKEEEQAQ